MTAAPKIANPTKEEIENIIIESIERDADLGLDFNLRPAEFRLYQDIYFALLDAWGGEISKEQENAIDAWSRKNQLTRDF